jgi:hypothetical protein
VSKAEKGPTYNLLIDTVSIDLAIAPVQHLGCLINLAFADEPPGRFWHKDKDDSNDSDHSPLIGIISKLIMKG